MRFPWLQIDADVIEAKASDLSVLIGLSRRETIGLLVDLWAWCLTRTPKDAPPDGIVRDSRTGTGAVPMLERAGSWAGPEGKLAAALEDVGLIERITDGIRFRGIGRYKATWEKNRRRKGSEPEPDKSRSGSVGDSSRKTQTYTQKEEATATQGPASAVPKVGPEELPDATDDATPVEPAANGCPDCTARAPCWVHIRDAVPAKSPKPPRQPSKAEAAYSRFQDARKSACEAAGVAYVPDRWPVPRINRDLGAILRGGEEEQGRFVATFEEYLSDSSMAEKGWSLSYLMSGGVRSKYEQRALNGERGAA